MKIRRAPLVLGSLVFATAAQAHTGAGSAHGFLHGLEHPVGGLDHVLAMVAIGLWAAQVGGSARWSFPLTFVGVMALGALAGMMGAPLPFVEGGILLSVVALGIFLVSSLRLPAVASLVLVGFFALFHGHAHGTEMPANTSGLLYAIGFALATLGLHLTGLFAGSAFQAPTRSLIPRLAGAAILLCGVWLVVQ